MTILQQQIVAIDNDIDVFVEYTGVNPERVMLKPFQPVKASGSSGEPIGPYLYDLPAGTTWKDFQVEFPFGPQDVEFEDYAAVTKKLPRPGKKPLLVFENPSLRTITFKAMIADKATHGCDPVPVVQVLDRMELIAANSIPCKFVYGVSAVPYAVTLTKFGFTVMQRNLQGNPIQVEVNVQLTETPLYDQKVVELEAVTFTGGGGGGGGSVTGSTPDEPDSITIIVDSNIFEGEDLVPGIG